jgi:hypothetical protein
MLKSAAYFVAFLAVLVAAVVLLERTSSPFFQSCISEKQTSEGSAAAEKNPSTFGSIVAITIVAIYVRCSGRFIDRHDASITALATIIIAAFTFTLWHSTEKMWTVTKLNVEALIDAERAHLYAVIKTDNLFAALRAASPIVQAEDGATVSPRPYLEFAIKNLGRSPAIMEKIGWSLVQRQPGIRTWEYSIGPIANPVIDGGKETEPATPCVFEAELRIADVRDAFSGVRPLYFAGYVVFTTSLDRIYEFRWQYENSGNRWLLTHYEEHQRPNRQP